MKKRRYVHRRKHMKKLLVSLAVLVLILASCGGGASGKPKIGVAIYKFDDTFMSYVRNAITENATDKAEIEVVDSQNAQPTQNDQVDAFLSKKMKAIAINPVDRTAAATIIEKAKAKKTPVVFFNREPLPEDMASWDKVYYVGAKAEQSGTMQGQIVVDYWKNNPAADKNKDGKIQYIMLKGEPGHQDAELRTQYSIKAVTDAGIEVDKLAEDTAFWDRPKAFEKMKAFYAAHGDKIEVVFCNNDDMALGAIEALKSEGYFAGGKQNCRGWRGRHGPRPPGAGGRHTPGHGSQRRKEPGQGHLRYRLRACQGRGRDQGRLGNHRRQVRLGSLSDGD